MSFIFNEIGFLKNLTSLPLTPLFSDVSCQTTASFSMILLENFLPALFVFKLQEQVGDPPDFSKAGILRSPHDECVGVGGSDFRSAFVR